MKKKTKKKTRTKVVKGMKLGAFLVLSDKNDYAILDLRKGNLSFSQDFSGFLGCRLSPYRLDVNGSYLEINKHIIVREKGESDKQFSERKAELWRSLI